MWLFRPDCRKYAFLNWFSNFKPNMLLSGMVWLVCATSLPAQFNQPYLKYFEKLTIQKGEAFSQGFSGDYLTGLKQWHFFDDHIPAIEIQEGKAQSKVGKGISSGLYSSFVSGELGVSNSRFVILTDYPVQTLNSLPEGKHKGSKSLSWDQSQFWVEGFCEAQKVTRFDIPLNADEKYSFGLLSTCLGSRLRPVISLSDSFGNLITRIQGKGDMENISVPRSGNYLIEIHDQTYEGGKEHFFSILLVNQKKLPKPWQFLASVVRHPKFGSSLHLAPSWKESFLKDDQLSVPVSSVGKAESMNKIVWNKVPLIHDPHLLRLESPTGTFVHAIRFRFSQNNKYKIENISHRLGLGAFYEFKLFELSQEGIPVHPKHSNPRNASIPFGKLHVAHYDHSLITNILQEKEYGLVYFNTFIQTSSSPIPDTFFSFRKQNDLLNRFRLVMLPMDYPNRDKNSRRINRRGMNLVNFQSHPIRLKVMRPDNMKANVRVKFNNVPDGINVQPSELSIPEDSSEAFILVKADKAQKDITSILRPSVIFSNNSDATSFESKRTYASSGPLWDVNDYNNETSDFIITDGMPLALDANYDSPVIVTSTAISQKVFKKDDSFELKISVERNEKAKDLELIFKDAFKRSGMPELKIPKDQNSATLSLDIKKLKWASGTHNLLYVATQKVKFPDRSTSEKKEKDFNVFAYTDLLAIEVQ